MTAAASAIGGRPAARYRSMAGPSPTVFHRWFGYHAPALRRLTVAAALGHVDAFNVADGQEAIYERYYRLLNCGIRLPLSTGTDWWIYDHNRVYAQVNGNFSYEAWIAALRGGRTFVTNGPLLFLTVNGQGPGATLRGGDPPPGARRARRSRE